MTPWELTESCRESRFYNLFEKAIGKIMFKKSKGESSFNVRRVSSSDAEKKETLEELGYEFNSVTKKSGWSWSRSTGHSDHNHPTEGGVIEDAWRDAGERTQAAMGIPADTWNRMSVKEQNELIREALSGC